MTDLLKNKRVLVTGGAGFIELLQELVQPIIEGLGQRDMSSTKCVFSVT